MARRAHKKSRGGCFECKRRHIKCDENRPICSHCISSRRLCGYAGFRIISSQYGASSGSPPPESQSPTSSMPLDTSPSIPTQPDPPANMLHAELFHHLSIETLPSLYDSGSNLSLSPAALINFGLATPYLFNELLALAALHLGIQRKSQQDTYRRHSAQLQNHALRLLQESQSELDPDGGIPSVPYSAAMNFQNFLDRFIHYLRLHRGVRTIAGGNWSHLKQTSLKPVLEECEASVSNNIRDGAVQVCSRLSQLIQAAKLGDTFTKTYVEVINALQRAMNAVQSSSPIEKLNRAPFWPVVVPDGFVDMLVHRRPEALVLLAHFAALLHSCRDLWIVGDGGRFMVESISQELGSEWAEWIEWPIRSLEQSTEDSTAPGNGIKSN
ncbi:hypothetical protein BDV09DRAFT_58870 [Aspergillus tetrazonus]